MAKAGVVVPAIIACLVICGLVLITCKFCSNPQFLWRFRRSDIESGYGGSSSDGEKPPRGRVISREVVSVSSSSDFSSTATSLPEAIPVYDAVHPDQDHPDATVIEVDPHAPPILQATPPR